MTRDYHVDLWHPYLEIRLPMRRPHVRLRTLLFSAVVVVAADSGGEPAFAQIPDRFSNLKVLPSDITRSELTATMRGFTQALGVRCSTCHVGEEGKPLTTYDFASDEKPTKRKAREMLRMVKAVNEEYLAKLREDDAARISVTCATCHGGVPRPEPIEDVVQRTLQEEGLDSAIGLYRQLRSEYYGGRGYDFTDRPLIVVADRVFQQGSPEVALRLLGLNVEFLPRSSLGYAAIGQVYERMGNTSRAIEHYSKALQLDPANALALQRLKALGG